MIVLDTHAWIWWWANRKKLSRDALKSIERARSIYIPAISCWELCLLVRRHRVEIDVPPLEWISSALEAQRFELQPLTPAIADLGSAYSSDALPDPADRIIVATASILNYPLVSSDDKIHKSGLVQCIW